MRVRRLGALAPAGSTGNNTHASVSVPQDTDILLLEVRVTAVGATPQFTYKFQGSDDDGSLADSASDWYDLSVLPEGANAEVATVTQNPSVAGTVSEYTVEMARRATTKVRLVTSANTNTTYDGETRGGADI